MKRGPVRDPALLKQLTSPRGTGCIPTVYLVIQTATTRPMKPQVPVLKSLQRLWRDHSLPPTQLWMCVYVYGKHTHLGCFNARVEIGQGGSLQGPGPVRKQKENQTKEKCGGLDSIWMSLGLVNFRWTQTPPRAWSESMMQPPPLRSLGPGRQTDCKFGVCCFEWKKGETQCYHNTPLEDVRV